MIRLAIRKPRGRVYEGDIDEEAEERECPGVGQLEAIGQGAGEKGC